MTIYACIAKSNIQFAPLINVDDLIHCDTYARIRLLINLLRKYVHYQIK